MTEAGRMVPVLLHPHTQALEALLISGEGDGRDAGRNGPLHHPQGSLPDTVQQTPPQQQLQQFWRQRHASAQPQLWVSPPALASLREQAKQLQQQKRAKQRQHITLDSTPGRYELPRELQQHFDQQEQQVPHGHSNGSTRTFRLVGASPAPQSALAAPQRRERNGGVLVPIRMLASLLIAEGAAHHHPANGGGAGVLGGGGGGGGSGTGAGAGADVAASGGGRSAAAHPTRRRRSLPGDGGAATISRPEGAAANAPGGGGGGAGQRATRMMGRHELLEEGAALPTVAAELRRAPWALTPSGEGAEGGQTPAGAPPHSDLPPDTDMDTRRSNENMDWTQHPPPQPHHYHAWAATQPPSHFALCHGPPLAARRPGGPAPPPIPSPGSAPPFAAGRPCPPLATCRSADQPPLGSTRRRPPPPPLRTPSSSNMPRPHPPQPETQPHLLAAAYPPQGEARTHSQPQTERPPPQAQTQTQAAAVSALETHGPGGALLLAARPSAAVAAEDDEGDGAMLIDVGSADRSAEGALLPTPERPRGVRSAPGGWDALRGLSFRGGEDEADRDVGVGGAGRAGDGVLATLALLSPPRAEHPNHREHEQRAADDAGAAGGLSLWPSQPPPPPPPQQQKPEGGREEVSAMVLEEPLRPGWPEAVMDGPEGAGGGSHAGGLERRNSSGMDAAGKLGGGSGGSGAAGADGEDGFEADDEADGEGEAGAREERARGALRPAGRSVRWRPLPGLTAPPPWYLAGLATSPPPPRAPGPGLASFSSLVNALPCGTCAAPPHPHARHEHQLPYSILAPTEAPRGVDAGPGLGDGQFEAAAPPAVVSLEEVLQLKCSLRRAIQGHNLGAIGLVLSLLGALPVTPQLLAESQVAALVTPLQHSSSGEVAAAARHLVSRWKDVLKEASRRSCTGPLAPAAAAAAAAASIATTTAAAITDMDLDGRAPLRPAVTRGAGGLSNPPPLPPRPARLPWGPVGAVEEVALRPVAKTTTTTTTTAAAAAAGAVELLPRRHCEREHGHHGHLHATQRQQQQRDVDARDQTGPAHHHHHHHHHHQQQLLLQRSGTRGVELCLHALSLARSQSAVLPEALTATAAAAEATTAAVSAVAAGGAAMGVSAAGGRIGLDILGAQSDVRPRSGVQVRLQLAPLQPEPVWTGTADGGGGDGAPAAIQRRLGQGDCREGGAVAAQAVAAVPQLGGMKERAGEGNTASESRTVTEVEGGSSGEDTNDEGAAGGGGGDGGGRSRATGAVGTGFGGFLPGFGGDDGHGGCYSGGIGATSGSTRSFSPLPTPTAGASTLAANGGGSGHSTEAAVMPTDRFGCGKPRPRAPSGSGPAVSGVAATAPMPIASAAAAGAIVACASLPVPLPPPHPTKFSPRAALPLQPQAAAVAAAAADAVPGGGILMPSPPRALSQPQMAPPPGGGGCRKRKGGRPSSRRRSANPGKRPASAAALGQLAGPRSGLPGGLTLHTPPDAVGTATGGDHTGGDGSPRFPTPLGGPMAGVKTPARSSLLGLPAPLSKRQRHHHASAPGGGGGGSGGASAMHGGGGGATQVRRVSLLLSSLDIGSCSGGGGVGDGAEGDAEEVAATDGDANVDAGGRNQEQREVAMVTSDADGDLVPVGPQYGGGSIGSGGGIVAGSWVAWDIGGAELIPVPIRSRGGRDSGAPPPPQGTGPGLGST